ncbi:MAG: DoxX family protein [Gammaproteobacteria bacterium]|nr:DoxX family protein [Gammaproteobacteria bacterium]
MKLRIAQRTDLVARVLMATIFIVAGFGKIRSAELTHAYIESFGLPGELLWPTVVFEVSVGLLLAAGAFTRFAALLLAGFTLLSASIFHADFGDRMQLVPFLKNLAIAGGLLMIAKHGSPSFSVDGLRNESNSPHPN